MVPYDFGRSAKKYQGDHPYHYAVTEPDPTRTCFTLADRPPEHSVWKSYVIPSSQIGPRVDGKARAKEVAKVVPVKVSAPEPKAAEKKKPAPKQKAKVVKPPKPPKPVKAKHYGGYVRIPLKLMTDGVVCDVQSFTKLLIDHGRQVGGKARETMNDIGFHVFKDGAVVWLADRPTPSAVTMRMGGLLSRAIEMNAKEA